MRALLALAFFIAPAAAFLGPALSQSAPRMAVRKEPLRMSVATPPTVSVETLIVAMGDDTRLKIRLAPDTFKELVKCSNALLASFRSLREMEAQEKPLKREPSMEFVTKNFDTLFELECNPNIYPDAVHAQVFVRVKNDVSEVTSQCQLSNLVDALKTYKATYKVKLTDDSNKA